MIELGVHTNLILGTYAMVALVTLGMVAATIVSARAKAKRLHALEASGLRRRSDQTQTDTA